MPNINKVVYGNNTLIDLTGTTATADTIMEGYGAYGKDGAWIDGTKTINLQEKTVSPIESTQVVTADMPTETIVSDTLSTWSMAAGSYSGSTQKINLTIKSGMTSWISTFPHTFRFYLHYGKWSLDNNFNVTNFGEKTIDTIVTLSTTNFRVTIPTDDAWIDEMWLAPPYSNQTGVSINIKYKSGLSSDYQIQIMDEGSEFGSSGWPLNNHNNAFRFYGLTGTIYDGLSQVTVSAIPSDYIGSAIDQRDGDDLTASGATVSVPAGYYAEAASKSVASGIAGTPTATKGTVSNHSVSVTPSVTNTTGYITGGTKTGTAVTVSASELVSGTLTISSSGTKDVTNYASASVNAGTATNSGTASVGGATVTAGTNSITLSKSVPITPDVTAGYISSGTSGNVSVSLTGSVTTKARATYTPTITNQTIAAGTYLTGAQTISGDSNLVAENIKSGVTIFGVEGTHKSGKTHSATITETGDSYNAYAKYPSSTGTKYYTAGQTFEIEEGQEIYFYARAQRTTAKIYLNGEIVADDAQTGSTQYNYIVPANTNVAIRLSYGSSTTIHITETPDFIAKTVTPTKSTQIITPDVIDETTIISQALSSYGGSHKVTSGGSWYTDVTLASGQESRFTSFPMSIHLYIYFRSEGVMSGGSSYMRGADTKIDLTVTLPSENYSVEIPVSSTYIKKIVLEPYSSSNRKPRIYIYDPDSFSTSNFYVYIRNADASFPQYGWSSAPYDNAFRIYPVTVYDGLSQVTVNGDANLIASNIKSGVEIFGVTGTYQADTGAVADEITQLQGGGDWHNVYGVDLTQDTVTADKLLTGYTAHDSAGNAITGTYSGGGGSGLEYEEGTWTPSTDTERELISFTNTHTDPPIFVMLTDATGTDDQTSSTNYSFSYTGYYNYSGEASPSTLTSNCRYGQVNYVYRGTGNPSGGTINVSSLTGGSAYDQDYYVSNTGFYPYTNSTSRYWRTTRTYKWIAVWGI